MPKKRTATPSPQRRRRLAAVLLLALACAPGPPRTRGPSYDAPDAPFLASPPAALERSDAPVHRLVLIGDAGDPKPADPTLAALGRWSDTHADRTTVLFLGDNVYPAGLRADERARDEAILRQLLSATRASRIFVPGNHDWGPSARATTTGTLHDQQRFIESSGAEFAPRDGCPGPVARELVPPGAGLAGGLALLIVDFHWWLLAADERPSCPGVPDTEAFLALLRDELTRRAGRNVVVAAHHPLRSGGTHGGLTRGFWTDVGAALYYRLRGPLQDLWEPGYAEMIGVVSEVLAEAPPLAFVAGHDHSLQVLDGGDAARLLIVSGAGSASKITGVTALPETLFAHAHPGFVVVDFFARGAGAGDLAVVRVIETGREEPAFVLGLELEARAAQPADQARVVSPIDPARRGPRHAPRHGSCSP